MNVLSIHLQSVSKKYHNHFLYKNLNLDILHADKIVITGNNGSGKSTLLKIIAGIVSPSNGKVIYKLNDNELEKNKWHQYISIAAPYMHIPEEWSVKELIAHTKVFRQFLADEKELLKLLELDNHLDKPIKQFSSGMKQKTKLLLAIADAAPILLLDEPCSNLDTNAVKWYENMINDFALKKTILVFSNSRSEEYFFCNKHFSLS